MLFIIHNKDKIYRTWFNDKGIGAVNPWSGAYLLKRSYFLVKPDNIIRHPVLCNQKYYIAIGFRKPKEDDEL